MPSAACGCRRRQPQSAQPGDYATTLTFFAFTIIVLGGVGRVKGPIVGAIIFFFVIQFVDNILQRGDRATTGCPTGSSQRTTSAR